jgi:hypothetical protein
MVLADLDVHLLVQITLDGLTDAYVQDSGLAHQPRRVTRGHGLDEADQDAPDAD